MFCCFSHGRCRMTDLQPPRCSNVSGISGTKKLLVPTLALCRSKVPELFLDQETNLIFRLSHAYIPTLITNEEEVKHRPAACWIDTEVVHILTCCFCKLSQASPGSQLASLQLAGRLKDVLKDSGLLKTRKTLLCFRWLTSFEDISRHVSL